ncbi:hypothetical protein [Streptomyces iconiensis]|uniref:HTH cro/C1-type domain-containing protein n=1 Tax=Streptomyces iconiensis TaxID=1384038 RepID=A0ABT6ZU96_9ACTN|nr:hypothetical protein [Streptomyces iconiensis]MDJ1132432.1 hypothetical protein [Streptomyces iconiensis]
MDRAQAYAALGRAIRDDRIKKGFSSMEKLSQRIRENGHKVSARTIGAIERGDVPELDDKFPSTELIVAALGWKPGWVDRILAGEDPAAVLTSAKSADLGSTTARLTRAGLLEMLPAVYAFSRGVVALGGDPHLRDEFDRLADQLVASLPSARSYGLAAYRPHAEGEGAAVDDAHRIARALDGE